MFQIDEKKETLTFLYTAAQYPPYFNYNLCVSDEKQQRVLLYSCRRMPSH